MSAGEKQTLNLKQDIKEFGKILIDRIEDCNQVYLISHEKPDFDAIASLGAMALVCKRHKKASYIIINEDFNTFSDEIKEMIEKISEKFVIVDAHHHENNKTDKDLLICLDVNKSFNTALDGKYKEFKDIMIVDHHFEDENTIKTSRNYKFIRSDVSSCSEIMYYLLRQNKIIPSDDAYYTYLLAGIYLDTNKLNKNRFNSTLDAAKELINKGANQSKVDDFFALDFESDRRVHSLVNKMIPITTTIFVSVCNEGIYSKEEVAKAADYGLGFKCDGTIVAATKEDGSYMVSARSKGHIGVANIMHILNNGGGNLVNASCPPIYVDDSNPDILKEKIIKILTFNKTDKE